MGTAWVVLPVTTITRSLPSGGSRRGVGRPAVRAEWGGRPLGRRAGAGKDTSERRAKPVPCMAAARRGERGEWHTSMTSGFMTRATSGDALFNFGYPPSALTDGGGPRHPILIVYDVQYDWGKKKFGYSEYPPPIGGHRRGWAETTKRPLS
jgi:hypothetical protein